MYGTWRFDSKSDNHTLTQKHVDPACARPVVQQACESCRRKKIKCSGQRPECSRCKALSKPCTYSAKPSPRRRSTKTAPAPPEAQLQAQDMGGNPQEESSQPQPSPKPRNTPEQSSKLQHGSGSSPMVIEAGNASTSMADADSVGMVQRSTPDFIMDQAWPTPLASPDHFDATSVDMTIFHNAEDMQTSMTSLDDWFGSNNALQADIAGSFPPSWMPIPEATNSHQEAESSETAKPKRLGILPTPTSSFSSHASSAAAAAQETCSCLQHVVFIVHELETAKMDSMDGQMASHKEALDYGQAMVMCERCSRRPENLMMLTFLSERLLHLSEAVIGRLAELDGEDRLAFIFGELEIDSAPEWDLLASSLAALQLSGLGRLLAQLKKSAETARADTVYQKVVDTEKLAKELMERLRRTVKRLYA